MKEDELRKHATCSLCSKPIGESRVPLFWRVSIERFGVRLDRIRRQDGLAAFLGGCAELAQIMGPSEDLAEPVMDKLTLTVCDTCACTASTCVAALAEKAPA